jgi:hypothetical protein
MLEGPRWHRKFNLVYQRT